MRTKRLPITGHNGVIRAYAIVDAEDHPRLAQYRWHFAGGDHQLVARWLPGKTGRRWLHHEALRVPQGSQVDHINGNQLDNRKENLRAATTAQNAQNQGSRGGSSRFRGVHWCATREKWCASAQLDRKKVNLGRYDDELVAREAAHKFRAEHMPFSEDARLAAERPLPVAA